MQYVGQTGGKLSLRMNGHRSDINLYPSKCTLINTHFNTNNHSISDFSFTPIEKLSNNNEHHRLIRETFWIHELQTKTPRGLNDSILFNVNILS